MSKYKYETSTSPLAAFIKAKYSAEITFDTRIDTKENGKKSVYFMFESDTIDFQNIENIFFKSFAQSFYNELQTVKVLVRSLLQ
jgi:hypothetical protein